MIWPVIISGFTLGAIGSLHCVGMCGPLSLALPVNHFDAFQKFIALSLYQAGRIITYSAIGLLFGLAGRGLYISGFQQWFSIIIGAIVLFFAVLYFLQKISSRPFFLSGFYNSIQKIIIRILKSSTSTVSFLLLGMANGLLPCGMVYIAMVTSLSFSQVTESIIFMALFGVGTAPAMMLVGYAGRLFNPQWRSQLRRLTPLFMTLMGVILILRGLNLGIPFISPELPHSPGAEVICHP